MSEKARSMTFVEAKESEHNAAFDSKWRRRKVSSEAAEKDPFGAWVEVDVGPLRLRLVRDRGEDHVDVEYATEGEMLRWVALEILAVVADLDLIDRYVEAFKATLKAATADQERLPACAAMHPDLLRVRRREHGQPGRRGSERANHPGGRSSYRGPDKSLERHGQRANDGLDGA